MLYLSQLRALYFKWQVHFPCTSSPINSTNIFLHANPFSTCLRLAKMQMLSLRTLNPLQAAPVFHPTKSRPSVHIRSRFSLSFSQANFFLLAAEAQEKKAQKATAEERARAHKDKQIMAKAKAAERERRQNQENIHRKLYLTSMSPSLNQLPLALDTRQWGEDNFCQPAPQDATVISHHISFFHACSLLLRCSSVCVTYLRESKRLPSVSLPAPARFLLHVLVRPLNPWHMMETCRQR